MIKEITRPNGNVYMTVYTDSEVVEFRNFTSRGITVRFDAKILDQLVPFLTEANFWRKAQND